MARKKIVKKSTKTRRKPGAKRRQRSRPRIKIVVAQPEQAPDTEAPEPEQLVKVNSAIVRRRQKARASRGAAPSKAVTAPRPTTPEGPRAAGKKRGRKLSATTEFVLSRASELSAAEVVRAAADKGIELNELLVHKVRSRYRGRTATGRANAQATSAAASTTSATTRAGGKKYRSASEFVREQPIDMPAREVVAKAAKLGLKVTAGTVRVTRFKMRHRGEAKPAAASRGSVRRGRPPRAAVVTGKAVRRGRPPAKAPAVAGGLSAAEFQLRRLVVELGTARAKALVAEVRNAIEALISV